MTQAFAPSARPSDVPLPSSHVGRVWRSLPTVIRYGLAGSSTQVLYLAVLAGALAFNLHYLACLTLAQGVAICYAFPVYRRHVFAAEGPISKQIMTFVGIWWTGAAMSFVGVPALVEGLDIPPFTAQLLVFVPVFTFSFWGHLRLTFGRRTRETPSTMAR